MAASTAVQASSALLRVQAAPASVTTCGGNREFSSFVGLRATCTSNVAKLVSSEFSSKSITTAAALMTTNGSVTTYTQAPFLKDPAKLIDSVETFVLDCDGVIWKGDQLIDGVAETLEELRAKGKRLVFVTNNSTKSRKEYAKKFASLGLDVSPEEIFASSFAAAAFLKSVDFPSGKTVYVIGEKGIQDELDLVGIKNFGGPEDASKTLKLAPGEYLSHDEEVGAVVVGFDRNINYYKIQYGALCLRENSGCLFIATNTDAVTHLTDAQEWAGGGSMVGALRGASQKEPRVVGKPSTFMLDYLSQKFGISKLQICMVGDRLDTDILFGKRGGTKTLLVLTGVTTLGDLQTSEVQPDFYANKLGDLRSYSAQEEEDSSKKSTVRGRGGLRGRGRGRPSPSSRSSPRSTPTESVSSFMIPVVEETPSLSASYVSEAASYEEVQRTPRLSPTRPIRGRAGRGRGGRVAASRSRSLSPSPSRTSSFSQVEEISAFVNETPIERSVARSASRRVVGRGRAGMPGRRSRSPTRNVSRSLSPSPSLSPSFSSDVEEAPMPFVDTPIGSPSPKSSRPVRGRAGRGRGPSRSPTRGRTASPSPPPSPATYVEEEAPPFSFESPSLEFPSPTPRSRPLVRGRAGMPGRGRGRSLSPPRGASRSSSLSPTRDVTPIAFEPTPPPPPPAAPVESSPVDMTSSTTPRSRPAVRGRAGMAGRGRGRSPARVTSRSLSASPSPPPPPAPVVEEAPVSVSPPTIGSPSLETVQTRTTTARSRTVGGVRGRGGRGRGASRSPLARRSIPVPEPEVEAPKSIATPVSFTSFETRPSPSPSPSRSPSPVRRTLPVRGRAGRGGRGRVSSLSARVARPSPAPKTLSPPSPPSPSSPSSPSPSEEAISVLENVTDIPEPTRAIKPRVRVVRRGLVGRGRRKIPIVRNQRSRSKLWDPAPSPDPLTKFFQNFREGLQQLLKSFT